MCLNDRIERFNSGRAGRNRGGWDVIGWVHEAQPGRRVWNAGGLCETRRQLARGSWAGRAGRAGQGAGGVRPRKGGAGLREGSAVT